MNKKPEYERKTRVEHAKYGVGTVVSADPCSKYSDSVKVYIKFDSSGRTLALIDPDLRKVES